MRGALRAAIKAEIRHRRREGRAAEFRLTWKVHRLTGTLHAEYKNARFTIMEKNGNFYPGIWVRFAGGGEDRIPLGSFFSEDAAKKAIVDWARNFFRESVQEIYSVDPRAEQAEELCFKVRSSAKLALAEFRAHRPEVLSSIRMVATQSLTNEMRALLQVLDAAERVVSDLEQKASKVEQLAKAEARKPV